MNNQRIRLWADESGDAGNRFKSGSSRAFVVAVVSTEDTEALEENHAKLLSDLGWSWRRELHAAEMSERDLRYVLSRAATWPIGLTAAIVDKPSVHAQWHTLEPDPYGFLLGHALTAAIDPGDYAHLCVDGVHTRVYAATLTTHLRRSLAQQGIKAGTIAFRRSRSAAALQIADLVAWSVAAAWQRDDTSYTALVPLLRTRRCTVK